MSKQEIIFTNISAEKLHNIFAEKNIKITKHDQGILEVRTAQCHEIIPAGKECVKISLKHNVGFYYLFPEILNGEIVEGRINNFSDTRLIIRLI